MLKQKLDLETQIWSRREAAEYIDNQAAGAGMESPAAANQHLLWTLNNIISQINRIMVGAGTGDWFQDIAAAGFDSFGLKEIHDKIFVYCSPIVGGTTDFAITGTPGGVLVDASMFIGGAGTIAVGASSSDNGGYVAADEAAFTVAGTLGIGLSTALDADSILLNKVEILQDGDNEIPVTVDNEPIFGLMQVITGTSDGAAIAAASSENLQISFVFIDQATDTITATTLPAGTYHFGASRQRNFHSLTRGATKGTSGADVLDGSGTIAKVPFREIDITGTKPAANDPMVVTTGTFTTAGAQTVASSFGTPALPATGAAFRDDPRIKGWLNGAKLSKGASAGENRDFYWVSATQIAFEEKLKNTDIFYLESPSSF